MSPKVKNRILSNIAILLGLVAFAVLLGVVFLPQADLPSMISEDICTKNHIRFDTSSIDRIFLETESILADPDAFLHEDTAYEMMARHRERVNAPFPTQEWLKDIEKLASQSLEKRMQRIPFKLYQLVIKYQQSFCQEVVNSVLAYLPDGTDLDVTIYLTAYEGSAAAFTREGEITFSLSHPLVIYPARIHEETGLSAFFNLALHEFFHIGFHKNSKPLSEEEHRKNEIVIDLLKSLQNEGIATYISYRLNPKYPTPLEWFTYLIDRKAVVRFYRGKLNEILADGSPPPALGEEYNQLYRRIGKVGYRWNGLYIVGGYMAMKIENKLGREALVRSIEDGFYNFAETYNSIADEDMKIIWEKVP
ncbi:MAG: hypothetical protein P8Y68_17665 [Anaerolineales bacterium]|jgi:hypothetical protein